MKKILLSLAVFFLLFTTKTYADSNFSTSFTGTYYVKDTGVTHSVFSVTLKNLTDRYYASSYSLQLGFSDIEHIYASDQDGPITPVLTKTPQGEELTFAFNHRAIGLGAALPFTFSFDTSNVATKNGSIWEVNIPGLQSPSDFANFSVSVNVPASFGPPVYMKPDVGNTLTFTKDNLGSSGISIAFGEKQVFHFNLLYHLKNTQLFPVRTEIALPPNTTYQTIAIDSLNPKPTTVLLDKDGNWLAQYSLRPSQSLSVQTDGRVFLSLSPTPQSLSASQFKDYLKPTTYWQTTNSQIISLAQQLKTPYAIYEYVVKTLHYDYARVSASQDRLGAVGVLQSPSSAVCLEFTDLFIALARAAGIPAREIDGYAYTQNAHDRPLSLQKDILHAWPEYYDATQQTWIMVDPTWENTTGGVDYFHTFDFDHIAFVIKGEDPNYPIPAGGYKLPGQENTQDVSVNFASDTLMPVPASNFVLTTPHSVLGGLPVLGDLFITNTSPVLFPAQPFSITITPSIPGLLSQNTQTQAIPPFGSADQVISFGKTPILTNKSGEVTIQLAGKSITKSLVITPFSLTIGLIIGGIIIGIFAITLLIITRKPRSVPIPEQPE